MKLDKQQAVAIGVIGLILILLVVYTVAMFGGKKQAHDEKFQAPEMTVNDAKSDYNERMAKELREKPQEPKKDVVLLNPFGADQDTDTVSTEPVKPAPVVKKHHTVTRTKPKRIKVVQQPVTPPPRKPRTKQRYGANQTAEKTAVQNNTVHAFVYGTQKIYNNSLVKMIITEPLTLADGVTIRKNSFIYGTAAFSNERIIINIPSITVNNVIHKANLQVYDANDGILGIYVRDTGVNDVAKKSQEEANSELLSTSNFGARGIVRAIGNEVKKISKKESVTLLDEHKLYIKLK